MNARIIHGLLWREWLLHHVTLAWIFSAWLFGVWVFPIHPAAFLLPFGILSALLIAPSLGGSDAAEGSEEFSFSLPPTRSQRYLARLAFGGGILGSLLLLGVAAGVFDLPQKLWGLIFESGFTRPFSPIEHSFLYVLSVAAPLAVFSECFVAGASSRTPESTRLVWLRGLFIGGLLAAASFFMEGIVWKGSVTGYIACPVFALWSVARIAHGYAEFRSKEGVSGLPRPAMRSGSRTWVVMVLIMLALLALVAVFWIAGGEGASPVQVDPPMKED